MAGLARHLGISLWNRVARLRNLNSWRGALDWSSRNRIFPLPNTGWAIGEPDHDNGQGGDRTAADVESLYQKLELVVIPMFYRPREEFLRLMRHSIALNGSYFNTQRMVLQYVLKAYF